MSRDLQASNQPGFVNKLRSRLNSGRAWLKQDLFGLFGKRLDEQSLEAIETQLLLADVGVEATEWLLRAMQRKSIGGDGRGDDAISRLRATVLELLEPLEQPLDVLSAGSPFVILAVGVNGTGKTTTLGKLAYRFKVEGRSVLLAAGDTFRAAAVAQLQEWGTRAGVAVVSQAEGADPAAVLHDALDSARANDIDVVLADTAGRLHTASGLMDELEKIKRVATKFDASAPHEVLLVLDGSQGQNALVQAQQFHARLGVTGLVITKLDGTAKGGILLAIARQLDLPVRYIAVGEDIEDFDVFRAAEFTRALIGDDPS